MPSLVSKMKDKLSIGGKKDDASRASSVGGRSSVTETEQQQPTAVTTAAHTGSSGAVTRETHTQSGSGVVAVPAGTNGAVAHSGNVEQAAPVVTVHERDGTWERARELTQAAEHASKVSAAKAYEAEAHLLAAQDAHNVAQAATNRHAELAAQAEAEKQNIGNLDYYHEELDREKHKLLEQEKIHKDINRQLDVARGDVAAKTQAYNEVAPLVNRHREEGDALANKLNSLRGARDELDQKRSAHISAVGQLQAKRAGLDGDLNRFTAEANDLEARAAELEQQARAARAAADERKKALSGIRSAAAEVEKEIEKASRAAQKVEKDLQGYEAKDADLAQKLAAAQAAAQKAFDLLGAREADLAAAKQALAAEEAKGLPVAQDIERFREEIQEKEHKYIEAQKTSQAARDAHARFLAAAEEAAREAAAHHATKEQKMALYHQLKAEAVQHNTREAELWEEAKRLGDKGDVNALQRLAEAEKNLLETQAAVAQPVVAPVVAPKQPTTQGPTLHTEEHAREHTDATEREHITTHH